MLTYSCGEVNDPPKSNIPGGVNRTFVLDPLLEKVGMFELFMFFWCIAFGVATEQMIMATSVSLW